MLNNWKKHEPKTSFLKRKKSNDQKVEFFDSTDHIEQYNNRDDDDVTDKLPERQIITKFDIFCIILSMLTYIFDIFSDIIVSIFHYFSGRLLLCFLISGLIIVPSIILNIVSFIWWYGDYKKQAKKTEDNKNSQPITKKEITWFFILSIFQLGPITWHYKSFKCAVQVYKANQDKNADNQVKLEYFRRYIEIDRNTALIRFFESALESLPQMLVQGCFILNQVNHPNFEISILICIQSLSFFMSLISACTSLAVEHRALRLADPRKENMQVVESIFQSLWRFFTLFSRFLLFLLCIQYIEMWFLLLLFIHIVLSTTNIVIFQTIDSGSELVHVGHILLLINVAIHMFLPYNMADGPTKWRYLSGYVLELLEIIVIVITMFINPLGKTFQYRDEFLALMIGSFMLGLSCMVMYYEYFHPSRARIETENESEIFKNASIGSDKDSGEEENSSVKYAKDDDEEFGDNVNV